jgi:hypothetical protein
MLHLCWPLRRLATSIGSSLPRRHSCLLRHSRPLHSRRQRCDPPSALMLFHISSVLEPFGVSQSTRRTGHRVSRAIGQMTNNAAADELAASPNARSQAKLRWGEDNMSHEEKREEMKEGEGGEGQHHSNEQKQDSGIAAHEEKPSNGTHPPASLSPNDASWFTSIFPTLASPALAVAIFHLPHADFSTQHADPALLHPAFAAHTYDAQHERALRDELGSYIDSMAPILHPSSSRSRERASRSTRRNGDRGTAQRSLQETASSSSSASNSRSRSPISAASRSMVRESIYLGRPTHARSGRNPRASIKRCFRNYTPLSLQTLPLLQRYNRVLHTLQQRKTSSISKLSDTQRQTDDDVSEATRRSTVDVSSSSFAAHPSTYVAGLPSLHHQLSKAITNRLTNLASTGGSVSPFGAVGGSGDRSFTSLVLHDAHITLDHLVSLLGLQGLHQQAMQHHRTRSAALSTSSSSTSASSSHVRPNLLLVNEENRIRKDLLAVINANNNRSTSSLNAPRPASLGVASSAPQQLSRLDAMPYFETVVRLLDQLAPQLLVEFVLINERLFASATATSSSSTNANIDGVARVSHAQMSLLSPMEMESHIERALRVVAPIHLTKPDAPRSSIDDAAAGRPSDVVVANRVRARCALLVLSGRPVEAVRLRLQLAHTANDDTLAQEHEEAAIVLACEILRDEEMREQRISSQRTISGARGVVAPTPYLFAASGSTLLVPTLRGDLFYHLLTHWLQCEHRRHAAAYVHGLSRLSAPLPTLDPRISSMMPSKLDARTYIELVRKEGKTFEEEQRNLHRPNSKSRTSASAAAAPRTSAWPIASPLLLPSPGDERKEDAPADLPMSCLLDQLRIMATRK